MTKDKNRINGNTHTKKGNSGFTELIRGYRYPKSDELCFIYNYFQSTVIDLQLFLNSIKDTNLLDKEDLEIISKLQNPILYDIAAITWSRFEELEGKVNQINNGYRNLVEERNQYLNDNFQNAKEFIVFTSTEVCKLSKLWINFRNIEHLIWKSIHRFYSYDINSIPDDVKGVGAFFNLVGDYFYNLCRYTQKKLSVPEEYWIHEEPKTIKISSREQEEIDLLVELNKINPNIKWTVYLCSDEWTWILYEEGMKGFHLLNNTKDEVIDFVKNYNE